MIPAAPCDDMPEPCCVSLSDIASHLLSETFNALSECDGAEDCGGIIAYVTMGNGDDGIVDSLTVAFISTTASANTRPGQMGLYRATFDVRLRESGWPTAVVEGKQIVLPDPVVQAAAARYMLSRGEAIHRRLASLSTSRGLVPAGVRCSNGSVGTLSPLAPLGGVVGWTMQVTIDLPWN